MLTEDGKALGNLLLLKRLSHITQCGCDRCWYQTILLTITNFCKVAATTMVPYHTTSRRMRYGLVQQHTS
eukprot:scaffold4612_cov147-Amphora_coffeaeformis.AAC.1